MGACDPPTPNRSPARAANSSGAESESSVPDSSTIVVHPAARVNAFTLGSGLYNTSVRESLMPSGLSRVDAVYEIIASQPPAVESWWSMAVFKNQRRSAKNWVLGHGFVIDLDYKNEDGEHAAPPDAARQAMMSAAFTNDFGANIFHETPRGARLIYVLDHPVDNADVWKSASKAVAKQAAKVLANAALSPDNRGNNGYEIDDSVAKDCAKLIYLPNAVVNGKPRQAEVVLLEQTPVALATYFQDSSVSEAVAKWNEDHAEISDQWPASNGECPLCEHDKCFGQVPDVDYRWACWSASHGQDSGVGVQHENHWSGDILDLEATKRGVTRMQVLLDDGYLTPRKRGAAAAPRVNQSELDDLLRHVALIEGTTTVIDARTLSVVAKEAFAMRYPRSYQPWLQHVDRRVLRPSQIRFSPAGVNEGELNLYRGLPLTPSPVASCARILAHLFLMCGSDYELAHDLTCWLAWPLQRPGKRVGYAYVVHGGQGTGKSMFFEQLMMRIYGVEHSIQIGQNELESKYTGWLSKKLFVVCNEVSTFANERKATKNKLKSLITDGVFTIEEKFMPIRMEENHAQFVFLSNEMQPVVPETDDRRYAILEFDTKMSAAYYEELAYEIHHGGAEAFYHYLLNYDLNGWDGSSAKPPSTKAKEELVAISRTPQEQFLAEWMADELPYPYTACAASDLWHAYQLYCKMNGFAPGSRNLFGRYVTKRSNTVDDKKRIGNSVIWIRVPSKHSMDDAVVMESIGRFASAYNDTYTKFITRIKL